jgi:predicted PurR-regulated permease PerM
LVTILWLDWYVLKQSNSVLSSILFQPFPYSAGFLSGLATVIPFIPEWIAYIPSFAVLYFKGSTYLLPIGVGLYVVRWLAGNIDDAIYSQIPGSNPFITGLALAFGASTYGIQGLLIGPIMIILAKTLFSIFTSYLHLDDHSAEQPPAAPLGDKEEVKE